MKTIRSSRRTASQLLVCAFVLAAATTATRPAFCTPLSGGETIQPICPSDNHWGLDGEVPSPTDSQVTSSPVLPDPFYDQDVSPLAQPFNPLAPESPSARPQ